VADSLVVDTAALTEAGASLADVSRAFDSANVDARGLGDAIGHGGLAGAVAGFAMGWDDIRLGMGRDIGFLAEACTKIGATMEKLDAELATQIRKPS